MYISLLNTISFTCFIYISLVNYYFFFFFFFFFNDTATTEIYTLSLHDALPICVVVATTLQEAHDAVDFMLVDDKYGVDRKSTRLNSSHGYISYAVFCLKKKKKKKNKTLTTKNNKHK